MRLWLEDRPLATPRAKLLLAPPAPDPRRNCKPVAVPSLGEHGALVANLRNFCGRQLGRDEGAEVVLAAVGALPRPGRIHVDELSHRLCP